MFAVVDAVDFRPLPFPDAAQLISLHELAPSDPKLCAGRIGCLRSMSTPVAEEWKTRTAVLRGFGLYRGSFARLQAADATQHVMAAEVSPELFSTLGIKPLLGRTFATFETGDAARPQAILSFDLWNARFGADPGIVGKEVLLIDDSRGNPATPYTIIGVMPKRFRVLSEAIWLPLRPLRAGRPDSRTYRTLFVLARLGPGRTVADAKREALTLGREFAREAGAAGVGWGADVLPYNGKSLTDLAFGNGGRTGSGRFALLSVVSLVLLLATINVAILFLVRATSRRQELALRAALGASHWRLASALLFECLWASAIGGVVGVLIAFWGVRLVSTALYLDSLAIPVVVGGRVLGFAACVTLATAILAGAFPVFWATRASTLDMGGFGIGRVLHGARIAHRVWSHDLLVALEVSCAVILVAAAGILSKELLLLQRDQPGHDPTNLYVLRARFPAAIDDDLDQRRVIAEAAGEHVRTVPGIREVAVAGYGAAPPSHLDGHSEPISDIVMPEQVSVSPEFFRVLRIPVVRGRSFGVTDTRGAPPVTIIDETAANRFWPGENPIGKRLVYGDGEANLVRAAVVGVVKRSRLEPPWRAGSAAPMVYRPIEQAPPRDATIFARSAERGLLVVPGLRRALHAFTGTPIDAKDVASQEDVIDAAFQQPRFIARALSVFAAFALSLAVTGIYGVVAFVTVQRTREIGIRRALGAQRLSILSLTMWRGLQIALVGIVAGIVTTLALGRVLRSIVTVASATDLSVFVLSSALLLIAVLVASYLPARHALRVSPSDALRTEQ